MENSRFSTNAWLKLSKKHSFYLPTWRPLKISPPKGELCSDDRSTVVQTFTPIDGTCAEISVPGHIHIRTKKELGGPTADNIYDKTHTSFVV